MEISEADLSGLSITASLGVSSRCLGGRDPRELIDQADKSLYLAKREGRNRVARFDKACSAEAAVASSGVPNGGMNDAQATGDESESSIPFDVVTGLVSALAYRDSATAEHSRRVADLCVATARRLMSVSDSYVLEVAALLHDIGKIGVPDSILLKPGKLTDDEWRVMNAQTRIGNEIVHSTFSRASSSVRSR